MSYTFNPLSEEEINAANIMDEGIYNFEVIKSTHKTSKSGNPMAELNLTIWDNEGKEHTVFDYLVFSNVPLNIKKVKHFCDAVGLQEEYKKGQIREDLQKLSGKAQIGLQEKKLKNIDKPENGFYEARNIIVDYMMTDKGAVKYEINVTEPFNDDLPF